MAEKRNSVKIVCRDGEISYYCKNIDNAWIEVKDHTSELSRSAFKYTSLTEKSEDIVRVIDKEYNSDGLGVDIIYIGDDENYMSLELSIKNKFPYKNITYVRQKKISAVFAGILGSGKTTLIEAIGKYTSAVWETNANEMFTVYKDASQQMEFYELSGFDGWNDSSISQVINTVTELEANGLDEFVYCINSSSSKIFYIEQKIIKEIKASHPQIKLLILCTKSITADSETFAEEMSELFDGVKVIPILAIDYKTRVGTIEAYGLDDAVNYILGW